MAGTGPGCRQCWSPVWPPSVNTFPSLLLTSAWSTFQVSSSHLTSPQTELYPFNTSDESNSLSLQSELSVYNPSLPLTMRFPGPGFCLENNLFMIVGSIPAKTKKNLEVYFVANGTDEAFHMREGFEIKSRPLILQLIRLDYYTFVPLVWRWRRSTFGGGQCLRISPRICRDSQGTELR